MASLTMKEDEVSPANMGFRIPVTFPCNRIFSFSLGKLHAGQNLFFYFWKPLNSD
jgi:hypothetical protein